MKISPRHCLANILAKFSSSENNHVYSIVESVFSDYRYSSQSAVCLYCACGRSCNTKKIISTKMDSPF